MLKQTFIPFQIIRNRVFLDFQGTQLQQITRVDSSCNNPPTHCNALLRYLTLCLTFQATDHSSPDLIQFLFVLKGLSSYHN